jgi:hypothetical protein
VLHEYALLGTIPAAIELENGRQLRAKVHRLSITGGLLELATYVDKRASVSLTLYLGSSIVRPRAEMLFPMLRGQSFLQPFRFTGLWAEERHILGSEITALLKQTMAPAKTGDRLDSRPTRFLLE